MASSPEDMALAFGTRVRAIREAIDWSQEKLAEFAGLDPATISKIERGIENPTLMSMAKVALALDENFQGFEQCLAMPGES